MIHHIKHSKNWSLVNELHDHLWKSFPMDQFEFIPTSGEITPEYSGTILPVDPIFVVMQGEQPKVAFFDDVSLAIQAFLSGQSAEAPEEDAVESTAKRNVA